jgi:hypothetical protein
LDKSPVRNGRVFSCALPHIPPEASQLLSYHRNEVLRGTTMKAFFKAILTTTAFALALSVSLASLSTAAQAYAYFGD